jgi:hypothetical protein
MSKKLPPILIYFSKNYFILFCVWRELKNIMRIFLYILFFDMNSPREINFVGPILLLKLPFYYSNYVLIIGR